MTDQDLLNQPPTVTETEENNASPAADALASFLAGRGDSELDQQMESLQAQIALEDLSPARMYAKRLEQEKVSLAEARAIVDHMCVQLKPFMKSYTVLKGTKAVFQTRTPEMQQRIDLDLERMNFRLAGSIEHFRAKMHLTYSLVQYGDTVFVKDPKEFDPDERNKVFNFVNRMPEPLFRLLWAKLSEFENLIILALSDGFEENF